MITRRSAQSSAHSTASLKLNLAPPPVPPKPCALSSSAAAHGTPLLIAQSGLRAPPPQPLCPSLPTSPSLHSPWPRPSCLHSASGPVAAPRLVPNPDPQQLFSPLLTSLPRLKSHHL